MPLYGSGQSRFARYLERREQRRPDHVSREHRRRLLAGLCGRVLEVGCGDGRAFELYPATVEHERRHAPRRVQAVEKLARVGPVDDVHRAPLKRDSKVRAKQPHLVAIARHRAVVEQHPPTIAGWIYACRAGATARSRSH